MARPMNKKELIEFSDAKFTLLMERVRDMPEKEIVKLRSNQRSVKDNLAHVYAWQLMMLDWYAIGMTGKKPDMPLKGYTWKDSVRLNKMIDDTYKDTALKTVLGNLTKTHTKLIQIMKKHSEKELFTKKLYPWTGSSSLAVYLRLATYSHYDWALKKIKKIM